ncbi:hypothetical protein ERO13_A13G091445v2 [Gossypium hirsutum]|uniref:Uncharacterized protein n=4 Tax=Gossypium TaxID=3633 RepID=A0A5J5SXW4_GOSBA|nr:hypothetical protein ES319_A13G106400v1 [Gossypium barbadense]KAG4165779.1 hypothetical protein ERO13_A13G091445v2 [Gossypium hirsutum]TYG86152.1 hypothetical protein ES288_A13G112000v1 [Gossypium darwinii]TYH91419.1 hypothetical protein ES332_A13G114300v1 [Gossypium tomentosum]TYJ00786.1 hypothetical protein E1A91_A13G109100v1 [Gossypium mustelinum]
MGKPSLTLVFFFILLAKASYWQNGIEAREVPIQCYQSLFDTVVEVIQEAYEGITGDLVERKKCDSHFEVIGGGYKFRKIISL